MSEIRLLRADEIDCRISTVSEKGCSILLYKDARVDQNILDETFGSFGWQRHHHLIGSNLYCTVSVWDSEKEQWIEKEDVGTESYTEKEKGQASDSFKRACFNLGIGRELYTAPFIWINKEHVNLTQKNGKLTTYDKFFVKHIQYDNRRNITSLLIMDKNGKVVYQYGQSNDGQDVPDAGQDSEGGQNGPDDKQDSKDGYDSKPKIGEAHILSLMKAIAEKGITMDTINRLYHRSQPKELTIKQYKNIMDNLDRIKANQDEFEEEVKEAFPE